MRRTDRLFETIQLLRAAKGPLRAAEIAAALEVSTRTVYRDIAALQAMRTPILGEAGVGYVMRRGYDLPPVNFDAEEAEAVAVGLALIARIGDPGLLAAAGRAARKLSEAAPRTAALLTSAWGAQPPERADLSLIRHAIRSERSLEIVYRRADGETSRRRILPLALIYFIESAVLVAWCELRGDFRHFRPDRMAACRLGESGFRGRGEALRRRWDESLRAALLESERRAADGNPL